MPKINIFKDIGLYDFNYSNLKLDLVSKQILMESIQQQYKDFIKYVEQPLSNCDWNFLDRYLFPGLFIKNIAKFNQLQLMDTKY